MQAACFIPVENFRFRAYEIDARAPMLPVRVAYAVERVSHFLTTLLLRTQLCVYKDALRRP